MPDDDKPPLERPHDTDPAVADTLSSEERRALRGPDRAPLSAKTEIDRTPIPRGPRAVRSGDTLGRYELLEEVGEGGMATVFRARDRELRREVAVKVLFPHLARRPEIVHRFHREARAAASLEHPNILRIYDVGGADERSGAGPRTPDGDLDPPYIVMELIRGRTLLAEVEQRGPLLAEIVACIGARLADALAVAHAAGIIHRDIKPANVLVTGDGRLLLADFGVARIESDDSLVTRTGAVLGTPAYMSPEQARGETATARSDVYSLGATLYQLATGVLPFSGSPAKVIAAICAGPPMPALRRRPAVGPDLSRAIERTMAADPAMRPTDAAAFGTELVPIATAGGLGDLADELAAYLVDPNAFLRDRTPSVVTALVTAAEQAISDSRLPRAMALADRASALAPNDPAVSALISNVTAGGRSRQRRTWLAFGGAGVLAVGGAIAAVIALRGGAHAHPVAVAAADAGALALVHDPDASVLAAPADAMFVASTILDAAPTADAALRPRDAGAALGRPHLDATEAAIVNGLDASAPPPADAAPPPSPPDATAEPARGAIVIDTDSWCDVSIDGVPRGRNVPHKALPVTAGRHAVHCEKTNLDKHWDQDVEVAAGATVIVRGAFVGTYAVTFAVRGSEVIIDQLHYRPGSTAPVKGGRFAVNDVGVATDYVTFTAACTLRDTEGHLSCDP